MHSIQYNISRNHTRSFEGIEQLTYLLDAFGRTLNVEGDEGATSKAEKTPEVKAREAAEFLEEDQWWKRLANSSCHIPW